MIKWIDKAVEEAKEKAIQDRLNKLEDIHATCAKCNIVGHKVDMQSHFQYGLFGGSYNEYYHNGCYAEKFDVHFCPNKCGKWLPNKKK